KITAVLGAVGLLLMLLVFMGGGEERRLAYSWLFAFMTFLTVSLGAIFFVIVSFLTSASWSVTLRRTAEFFAAAIPVFALLFIPVFLSRDHLYEWAAHGAHSGDHADEHGDEHSQSDPLLGPSRAQAQDRPPAAEPHG